MSLRDTYEEVEGRNLYEAVLTFRTGHIAIGKCAPQTDVRYRSERDLLIVKKHLISKPVDDGAWNCQRPRHFARADDGQLPIGGMKLDAKRR